MFLFIGILLRRLYLCRSIKPNKSLKTLVTYRFFFSFKMASKQQSREELDEKAKQGETVVPGGTGGKSVEAQERLAEGIIYVLRFKILPLSSFSLGY